MTIEYHNFKGFVPKGYPVRHKRKVPFDPDIRVPREYAKRVHRIKELDFELDRFILTDKDYADLAMDAYISNVHWTTKVEGNPLHEDEVRKITLSTFGKGTDSMELPAGPKQEIINHLTRLISPGEIGDPWDHTLIQTIHDFLLKDTGARFRKRSYRKNHASVCDSTGEETFITCPPGSIEEEMESLLKWMNESAAAYDSIVSATVFFHEFESIHPFADGNGRTGRCLFHLFLQNAGLPNSHLCKIEKQLLSDEELYYQLLAYTDDSRSYEVLIDFVSDAILKSYLDAHKNLSEKDLLSSDLDEVSKRLLKVAKRRDEWFSVSEAVKWVSNTGAQTVRNKLNHLVEIGALEKVGRTQSCRYHIRNSLDDVRRLLSEDGF